jgi:hypothetical protein
MYHMHGPAGVGVGVVTGAMTPTRDCVVEVSEVIACMAMGVACVSVAPSGGVMGVGGKAVVIVLLVLLVLQLGSSVSLLSLLRSETARRESSSCNTDVAVTGVG